MNIVTRKLIAKEFHVNRYIVAGASAGGVLSILICALGKTGFSIGSLMWLTIIIANGVMLALYGVMNERKERSMLFVLSLPLSIADYVRAKMLGLALCFFIPWVVATVAALVLVLVKDDVPDGLVPYTVLLSVYMLANFLVLLCWTLHVNSEAWISAAIVLTNMGVSVYMFVVGAQPGLQSHIWGPTPVWNQTAWTILIVELGVIALSFTLPFFLAARRRDFI
jgi:ABC-type transport system involved in multi-copper enzyme maturation permease subunit